MCHMGYVINTRAWYCKSYKLYYHVQNDCCNKAHLDVATLTWKWVIYKSNANRSCSLILWMWQRKNWCLRKLCSVNTIWDKWYKRPECNVGKWAVSWGTDHVEQHLLYVITVEYVRIGSRENTWCLVKGVRTKRSVMVNNSKNTIFLFCSYVHTKPLKYHFCN